MKLSLFSEGIKYHPESETFQLDLDQDGVDDLVKLIGIPRIREKETRWYKVKIYYSFKIDANVTTRHAAKKLAQYLKQDNPNSDKFIQYAVEHFIENYANIDDIQLITYPESTSSFNARLADMLSTWLDVPVEPSGFIKKTLAATQVGPSDIKAMRRFKKEIYLGKNKVIDTIERYLYDPENGQAARYYHKTRVGPEAKYLAPLRKMLNITLPKFLDQARTSPTLENVDQLVEKAAEFWARHEANKLETGIRHSIGKGRAGQKKHKFQVKHITSKDKREFLDYLDINPELATYLEQPTQILVIDDNVDYGGTFARINKILSGIPNLTVHYYSPLAMSIDETIRPQLKPRHVKAEPSSRKPTAPQPLTKQFKSGDMVYHPIHGDGQVHATSGGTALVTFVNDFGVLDPSTRRQVSTAELN